MLMFGPEQLLVVGLRPRNITIRSLFRENNCMEITDSERPVRHVFGYRARKNPRMNLDFFRSSRASIPEISDYAFMRFICT